MVVLQRVPPLGHVPDSIMSNLKRVCRLPPTARRPPPSAASFSPPLPSPPLSSPLPHGTPHLFQPRRHTLFSLQPHAKCPEKARGPPRVPRGSRRPARVISRPTALALPISSSSCFRASLWFGLVFVLAHAPQTSSSSLTPSPSRANRVSLAAAAAVAVVPPRAFDVPSSPRASPLSPARTSLFGLVRNKDSFLH
jgi:hypothetical protein